MKKLTILVVEDDAAIRRGIVDALEFAGYGVLQAGTGSAAEELVTTATFDLALLDLVLPGKSGLDILRQLRESQPTLPAIVLTAKGSESDRIRGLRLGADDYVTKPFSIRELLARIEAVLRRSPERPHTLQTIKLPDGLADLERREIRFDNGATTDLTEREVDLLLYLASNANRAVARDELLTRIWHIKPQKVETRTIDMHIARLRDKLRTDPSQPDIIQTVRGKGYRFVSSTNTE